MNIYFHIGYHKTGTTALQAFLHENRNSLKEQGVNYVGMERNHYMYSVLYHRPEYYEALKPLEALPIRKALFHELKTRRYDKLIISSEGFCEGRFVPGLLAKDLKGVVDERDSVKIVIYLRRQDLWLQSAYQQRVKQTNFRESATFAETLGVNNEFVNYAVKLAQWEEPFGRENLIVRTYEPSLGMDILRDFAETVGFEYHESFVIPERRSSNMGINLDLLELMRILNKLGGSVEMHEKLLALGSEKMTTESGLSLLSVAQRVEILKKFEASNREVARRYLGREDGILFKDMAIDESCDDLHELTAEKAVELMLRVCNRN